jgi:hypothetical protein
MDGSEDLFAVKEIPNGLDTTKKIKGPLSLARMSFGAGEGI